MDGHDGQVPAPRRSVLPRLRRPVSPTELPFPDADDGDTPRVPDLSALLHDIDSLRLTLQTDLSLAAAALDAGADELAGELVDGDISEVRAFAARAAQRLAALDDVGAPQDEEPVPVPLRRRRIMSAGPLMAAAAALIGFVAFVPDRGAVSSSDTAMTSATMAGYELSRLAEQGAPDEQLLLAAEELNQELAELIAQAADDPVAAQQALMLLETTTAVLSRQGDSNVLRSVMAETRALRARLRDALPASVRTTRPAVRVVVPVLPRVQEEPEKERAAAEPKPTPRPASPTPTPTPTPTATAPAPQPTPSEEPSSGPSEQPDGPLPGPQDLPGS